jgi:multidrug resistance protein
MADFHSTNESLGAFMTTIFLLGYTFGPIVIAPLSEMYGRAIVYQICMVFFVVFNVACAVGSSLGSLVVFRLLAGIMGSCPVTLGTGSIADMVPREKRAGAMAAYVIGASLGPSIGPICGGYLTQAAGWRWNFWLLAIAAGAVTVVVFLFMHESYPYVLLKRKTERLRKQTRNPNLRSALDTGRTSRELFSFSILRPLKMLISPIVFLLSLHAAIVYSYLYLCFTTFPMVFRNQYGFGSGASGLATLGLGVGAIVGVFYCGASAEALSNYLTRKNGGEPQPEYRLPTLAIGGLCVPVGLFWYGWTAEHRAHWIVPIIGSGFLGAGMVITFVSLLMRRLHHLVPLTSILDGQHYVSRRRIYGLCSLGDGVQHHFTLSFRSAATPCWQRHVYFARSRLGKFGPWIYLCCLPSGSFRLLLLRSADARGQGVQNRILNELQSFYVGLFPWKPQGIVECV